jgi:hypothetical protein
MNGRSQNYNRTEEKNMSDIIESITEIVKVVVTGGNVSDMALHCDAAICC